MRRANLLAGALLAVLGGVAVVEAARIRDDWQGAKLMPAVVGVALLALGGAHVLAARRGEATPLGWPSAAEQGRVLCVFAILVLYVLALAPLGFLPATAALVLGLVRFMGGFSWPRALALAVAVAVISHIVFRHWLGMPLPAGRLGI